MRNRWSIALVLLVGCLPTRPEEQATPQVASLPFTEPRPAQPTKVSYAPASQDTSIRVLQLKDKLITANPQLGLDVRGIFAIAIASPDPELFHVGFDHIYVTETLVKQCQTDGQLSAVLAYELGRIISEREAAVSDEVRQPERPQPIPLPIGSIGNSRDADPIHYVEMAMYARDNPKRTTKLARPNPQVIARGILERACFQSTDFDAALPILQNAERFQVLEHQFKGTTKQGDWKAP